MWATVGHHYVYVDYYSKLPVTGCRPSEVLSMLGWQGWSCPRVSYHASERRCACFSYDISSWYIIVLHTPGLSGRSSKQSSFGYSSTAVWGSKWWIRWPLHLTSSTTGKYLNNKGVDPNTWFPNTHVDLIECKEILHHLLPRDYWVFPAPPFLVFVDPPE